MRTSITLGLNRSTGKWVMLFGPDISLMVQSDFVTSLLGRPNDEFSQVRYQEDDGRARCEDFLTAKETSDREAKNRAADETAKQWDMKVEADRLAMIKKGETERSLRHKAEIEALNAQTKNSFKGSDFLSQADKPADKLFIDEKTGLRIDGPTLEDWLVNGMESGANPKQYPPKGYAAKPSPAWSKRVEADTVAAEEKAKAELAKAEAEAATAKQVAAPNKKNK